MSDYKDQAVSDIGTTHEKEHALLDARDIIRERGHAVTVRLHDEGNVSRDRLGSIKQRATATPDLSFYAFPIIYNPTDKQREKAGLREQTQVLIKTAVQDWVDNGFTVDTLAAIDSIRATIIIKGAKYEIRDKQLDSQYGDTFLYIHLGLNRI